MCTTTCNRNMDCAAPRPVCLRPTGGMTSLCVECGADTDCASRLDGRTRCDTTTNSCAQCTAGHPEASTGSGAGQAGAPLWGCAGLTSNVIPTPIAANDMVYAMSGFRGSSLLAIRLGKTGDLTGSDSIVWKHDRSTPYVPSPLLYGNRLYFFKSNDATLSCFDVTTGKPLVDQERLAGLRGA